MYSNYISQFDRTLIVIADDLRAYNLIIKNEETSIDEALVKARQKGDEILNLVSKTIGIADNPNIVIKKWKDIMEIEDFLKIKNVVNTTINSHEEVKAVVHDFILFNLRKFDVEADLESRYYENQYIVEEIAMSIYATEILDYSTELWEKSPVDSPDPIKFLYDNSTDIVKHITNKSVLHRRLITLNIE